MHVDVCIPTSVFKHTAVGTPAQTCHAIQLEREIQGQETESDQICLALSVCKGSENPDEVWKRPLEPRVNEVAD